MQAEINLRSIEVLEAKSHMRKLSAHLSTALKSVTAKSDLLARQHALLVNTDTKLANTNRSHAAAVTEYESSVATLKNHITTLARHVKLTRLRDEQKAQGTARRTQPAAPVSSNDAAHQRTPAPVSIQTRKPAHNTVPITKLKTARPGTQPTAAGHAPTTKQALRPATRPATRRATRQPTSATNQSTPRTRGVVAGKQPR